MSSMTKPAFWQVLVLSGGRGQQGRSVHNCPEAAVWCQSLPDRRTEHISNTVTEQSGECHTTMLLLRPFLLIAGNSQPTTNSYPDGKIGKLQFNWWYCGALGLPLHNPVDTVVMVTALLHSSVLY